MTRLHRKAERHRPTSAPRMKSVPRSNGLRDRAVGVEFLLKDVVCRMRLARDVEPLRAERPRENPFIDHGHHIGLNVIVRDDG